MHWFKYAPAYVIIKEDSNNIIFGGLFTDTHNVSQLITKPYNFRQTQTAKV